MEILQRILLPEAADVSGLYLLTCGALRLRRDAQGSRLTLAPGQTVSADTYFNSYYQQHYTAHTAVRQASLHLSLSGDVEVALVRS
ncbi:MAG: hypothetical protein HQK82_15400, partial [Desulfovibrionaceae bacterium]|nr:hypothetical protein [Desulfovibrionaceae bacterium]